MVVPAQILEIIQELSCRILLLGCLNLNFFGYNLQNLKISVGFFFAFNLDMVPQENWGTDFFFWLGGRENGEVASLEGKIHSL